MEEKNERIILKSSLNKEFTHDDRKKHEHMFTYPFTKVDNSLHSCEGLNEFSHHSLTDNLHDDIYGKDNIALSIIINETSVSSVTPGHDMDEDTINFCLLW